jgi:hypothetical protein
MGTRNSKKLGKGTNPAVVNHYLQSKSAWFLQSKRPLCVFPGAIFDVDDVVDPTYLSDAYRRTQHVLPPGIPLDEDLVEALLQHLKWDRDSRFGLRWVSEFFLKLKYEEIAALQEVCTNAIEQIYMEALWRKIQKNKK